MLAEIEALYPGAEIDVISGGTIGEQLFTERFHLRRVYSLPRKIARHLWATVKLLRQLRRDTYDLAIDACIDSQSGRLLLAITKARFKLGYPDKQSPAAAAWEGLPRPEHLAKRSVFLLRSAYAGEVSRPCPPLNLRLQKTEKDRGREVLEAVLGDQEQAPSPRIVVGVFANATGAKRYCGDWWGQFLENLMLRQPDVRIVNLLAEHGESQLDERHASYYTRDPRRLAAMIAGMDAFISADCGVMHLAAATGTPTLGLFSTSSSAKYGPYGKDNTAIDTRDMSAADVAAIAADWLKLTAAKSLLGDEASRKA
ncbi:glycosyltransferase family 9 protein [Rhodanobacter sp. FW106-PBR-LB-2-11]|uniref:glycosyltransferase family 9 protein n=1 Tax=Rhodanobacter sp. FW106-PBR-LB-2-11 TaxID=1524463 RepID=UPI0034E4B6C4